MWVWRLMLWVCTLEAIHEGSLVAAHEQYAGCMQDLQACVSCQEWRLRWPQCSCWGGDHEAKAQQSGGDLCRAATAGVYMRPRVAHFAVQ